MSWRRVRTWFSWPREAVSDLQADFARAMPVLVDIHNYTRETRAIVAADRELLAEIAAGLTALSTPVADLIASEAALRARVAELTDAAAADEAGDLAAAQNVKAAFDDLAGKFTAEPESPDVEPLPEIPADPESPPAVAPPPAA